MTFYNSRYLTRNWLMVYGYTVVLLVAAPYLPFFVQWSSSKWPVESVCRLVLGAQISLGFLLIISAALVFLWRPQRFPIFVFISAGLFVTTILCYRKAPSPYEFAHLPEYAILSFLIRQAIKENRTPSLVKRGEIGGTTVTEIEGSRNSVNAPYVKAAAITTAFGVIDELYQGLLPNRFFSWNDVFLNGLGAILGLTVVWGFFENSPERNRS